MTAQSRRLAKLDGEIAQDRRLYLEATWAGHDGEAQYYEVEVDRLLDLRSVLAAGVLPAKTRDRSV